jgi:hypothetical protein
MTLFSPFLRVPFGGTCVRAPLSSSYLLPNNLKLPIQQEEEPGRTLRRLSKLELRHVSENFN